MLRSWVVTSVRCALSQALGWKSNSGPHAVSCRCCSRGAKLMKWPREQMDKYGAWFLLGLFSGAQGGLHGCSSPAVFTAPTAVLFAARCLPFCAWQSVLRSVPHLQ